MYPPAVSRNIFETLGLLHSIKRTLDLMAKKLGKYEKYFATTNKLCKLAIAQWDQIRICHVLLRFHEIFLKLCNYYRFNGKKHPLKLGKYENYLK